MNTEWIDTPHPVSKDGWDITLWLGEDYGKASEIFEAVVEFIVGKFDIHPEDEPCVLSWVMGMGPADFSDFEEVPNAT